MVAGSESSKFRACGSNIYDPNSGGTFRANRCVFDAQGFDAIQVETYGSTRPSSESGAGDLLLTIDLSRSCSLYQTGLNEVRVNALFGLSLIRAYQA